MSYAFVFIIKCSLASYVILAIMLIVSMFWGGGNKKLLRWLTLAFIIFYVLMAFAFGFNDDVFIGGFDWIFPGLFLLHFQVLSFTIVSIFWGCGNKKLPRWLTLAFIIFYVLMAFAFGFNNDIFIDKFYWIFLSLFLLPLQVLSFTIVIITKIILICIIKPKT